MPDTVTAKNSDVKFTPHPEDQFVAQCVDCINLGDKVEDYPGKPKKLTPKCALVFRTGAKNAETGKLIDVSREFTVSMGELANLRKFLESWRGKAYTDEQIDAGIPLDKLVGNWALITVEHKKSGKGRTYAIINSIVSVPKMMTDRPSFPAYARDEFWAERKKEYAKDATALRAEFGVNEEGDPLPQDSTDFADDTHEGDDDLPF